MGFNSVFEGLMSLFSSRIPAWLLSLNVCYITVVV